MDNIKTHTMKINKYHALHSLNYYYRNKDKVNARRFKKVRCEICNYYYSLDKKSYHHNFQLRHQKALKKKEQEFTIRQFTMAKGEEWDFPNLNLLDFDPFNIEKN